MAFRFVSQTRTCYKRRPPSHRRLRCAIPVDATDTFRPTRDGPEFDATG